MSEKLVDIYRNSPSVENLCKYIKHDLLCDFILVYWFINNGFWFIPIIYDGLIEDSLNDNKNTGWYINEEPNIEPKSDNVPIRHSRLLDIMLIKSKSAGIYLSKINTSSLNTNYKFVIETFIETLALNDLLRRQKLKQEIMLSNISHSIRTPLNGILHMTNSIMTSKTQQKNQLEFLNQSSVALATNIFDIIDMTKLELGKLNINKEVFNLYDMISSIMTLANSLNKSSEVSLDSYIEKSVPEYIYSDQKRIKQILINLLENSLQYTKSGEIYLYVSSTLVSLLHEDSERGNSLINDVNKVYSGEPYYTDLGEMQHLINFAVKDSGIGMGETTRKNLFKPLELVDNSKPHGLSLRISYMLANVLGGKLSLIYSKPTVGSCFEFGLIANEEDQPFYITNTLKSLKNKNIILFDDNTDASPNSNISQFLIKHKVNLTTVSSIDELSILHNDKKLDMIIVKSNRDISEHINKLFPECLYLKFDPNEFKMKIIQAFNSKKSNKAYKILAVEDEQINRIVIEKLLKQLGYNSVDVANNGEEALKLITNNLGYYDLLLIDIRMPIMNGFELANKVKELYDLKELQLPKMIGITAQVVLKDERKPWFKDFVYKPIDIKDLEKTINILLQN